MKILMLASLLLDFLVADYVHCRSKGWILHRLADLIRVTECP